MTTAKFFLAKNKIRGFEISGHSGYADEGRDVVCSGVSSAAILAANIITDQLNIKADIREDDGHIYFLISGESEACDAVLEGLKKHLLAISKQYPQFLRILFGGVKND